MDGGEGLRPWWGAALRHGNGREKRGERWRSSPRIQRARGRGRGCPVAPESPARIHGGRSRIWRRRRLHGALRLAWLGEEVAGDEAELLGTTGRRGGGGGYGNGERWRRLRSGALGEERTREEGEREGGEKDRGGCVATCGPSRAREGSRRWPAGGRWRARVPASVGHTPFPCRGGRRQRRGGQVGWAASWLGRPAAAGLRRGGEAQVSPSFFIYVFSNFSDICFDLINILNHLILLCQFL